MAQLAPTDLRAEEVRLAQRLAAGLALDREGRAERLVAGRAAPQHHAAALQALLREFALELLEPAPRGAALKAERNPVAEHLAALLTQPVRRLAHGAIVAPVVRVTPPWRSPGKPSPSAR